MSIPQPNTPGFAEWCAEKANPSMLCQELASATPWPTHGWVALIVTGVVFALVIAYLAWFARRAHIGGRFIDALGGEDPAEEVLRRIEAENDCLLAGALSAYYFTEKDKKK